MEQNQPSDVVLNIGAHIYKHLNLDKHVTNVCKGAWMHLRNIGKLRPFLDNSSCEKLVHAFVSSKIDSNNGLLYGITKEKIHKIQRVQNAAGRIVSRTQNMTTKLQFSSLSIGYPFLNALLKLIYLRKLMTNYYCSVTCISYCMVHSDEAVTLLLSNPCEKGQCTRQWSVLLCCNNAIILSAKLKPNYLR